MELRHSSGEARLPAEYVHVRQTLSAMSDALSMQLALLALAVLMVPRAEARPVEKRLSQDPRTTSVEQLDLQILRFAAEHCALPAPQDTLRVAIHYKVPIRLSNARDQWGQPFVYNDPAIHGNAQYDLYSVGPNGVDESGRGDDVCNWKLRRDIASTWAARDDLAFWSRAYRTQRIILEGERADGHVASDPESPERQTDAGRTGTTGRMDGLLRRIVLLDGPLLLVVVGLWRRRLGLVVLTVVALTTASVAAPFEPGAIYRYTESQVYYLKWSILDFRASHCRYPAPGDTFATLAGAGLDSLSTLGGARDFWGRQFVMRAPSAGDDEFFDLYSVGRNGIDELGGGDDIGVDKAQRVFEEHYASRPGGNHDGGRHANPAADRPESELGARNPSPGDESSASALVGQWLGYLDGPLILLAVLGLRRRRTEDRSSL